MGIRKIGILPRLFAAIVIGALVGAFAPAWTIRALNTFSGVFGQYIKFIVPFIILGLVTPAIADTGRNAGKILLVTMGVAYASTLFAGYLAFAASSELLPRIVSGGLESGVAASNYSAYFKLPIPPVMDVVTALVVAFMFGLAIVSIKGETLYRFFSEMREAVMLTVVKTMVPVLPFFILAVIADLAASGKLKIVGSSCARIMFSAFAVTVFLLLVQYAVAGIVARRNPIKALWTQLPAYLTGFGCCSSAATIPVNLRQTKLNGVSDDTADLVIPLCANVHLAGSMSNMVFYTAGVLVLLGEPLSIAAYTEFILMISVIAVASPGIPGGVVLASASIAEAALGLSPERYSLVIAMYLALDGMGTACNLTGDGAIAIVVDRFRKVAERPESKKGKSDDGKGQ